MANYSKNVTELTRYKVITLTTNHKWQMKQKKSFSLAFPIVYLLLLEHIYLYFNPELFPFKCSTLKKASVVPVSLCEKDLIFGRNQFQLGFYSISDKSSQVYCAHSE